MSYKQVYIGERLHTVKCPKTFNGGGGCETGCCYDASSGTSSRRSCCDACSCRACTGESSWNGGSDGTSESGSGWHPHADGGESGNGCCGACSSGTSSAHSFRSACSHRTSCTGTQSANGGESGGSESGGGHHQRVRHRHNPSWIEVLCLV